MSTFDKREDGFEKKFAHDEELQFRVLARRNKLIGLWAAEKLGKAGAQAEAYASALVATEVDVGSDQAVIAKIRKDFDMAGVAQSDHQIARTLEELTAKARKDVEKA